MAATQTTAVRWTHAVQRDVAEFHRVVVGIEDPDTIAIRRPELRAALIEEEARETVEAIRRGDLVEAIDGMCDLLCVVYGTAAEFGVDLAPFWDEVHRTNMAKAGGPVREDGKRLKPDGWMPPDIAGVLARVRRPTDERSNQHYADITPTATWNRILAALDAWERAGCDCCSPTVLDDALDGVDPSTWERLRRFGIDLAQVAQWSIDEEAAEVPA